KVIASDSNVGEADITLKFYDGQKITLKIKTEPVSELIKHSDFITLHVPAQKGYIIDAAQIEQMKKGVGIINAARGGVLNEKALLNALRDNKVSFAALDVFESEPTPGIQVLMNEKISLSPHIGAATNEAQGRIGTELAEQIIALLG
ncbi:MAG: NAD(P)-dependent oxidoreductase, partial [Marinirhabdus sp.]